MMPLVCSMCENETDIFADDQCYDCCVEDVVDELKEFWLKYKKEFVAKIKEKYGFVDINDAEFLIENAEKRVGIWSEL